MSGKPQISETDVMSHTQAQDIVKMFGTPGVNNEDQRRRWAKVLRRGQMLPPNTEGITTPWKEPMRKNASGYGYVGAITKDLTGNFIQCHYCGYFFESVALHTANVHKIKAREYRQDLGLALGTRLQGDTYTEMARERAIELNKDKNWDRITQEGRAAASRQKASKRPRTVRTVEYLNKRGTCYDQTVDAIQRVSKALKHTPTKEEFEQLTNGGMLASAIQHFGTWQNALQMSGIEVVHGKSNHRTRKWTPEKILEALSEFAEIEQRPPRSRDLINVDWLPNPSTVCRAFGGIIQAREHLNLKEDWSR